MPTSVGIEESDSLSLAALNGIVHLPAHPEHAFGDTITITMSDRVLYRVMDRVLDRVLDRIWDRALDRVLDRFDRFDRVVDGLDKVRSQVS